MRLFLHGNITMRSLFLTLVLAVSWCGAVAAQSTSGYISGTVVDSQHAGIPNAKVTANETEKKFNLTTSTDAAGRFVFAQVEPGRYKITVTANGFRELIENDVVVNANDRITLGELNVTVGAVTEHVEVVANAVQLQTESADREEALVNKQILNVANNSRSALDLVKAVPGVVSTINLATAGPGGLSNISANGARVNSNQTMINGIGNTDTGSNGSVNVTVSIDSVEEFKILTGVYQAEYGRAMGAQINIVTKSGGSDLHGSGYFYHRNDSLNANNWLNNRNGLPRNIFRFNDFGFTLGGPVVIPKIVNGRQKLFFFVSEEFQRQLQPVATKFVTTPTAAERTGNYSSTVDLNGNPVVIKDPNTGLPFPNNTIPTSRLYAPGVALLNVLPVPNVTNSCALAPGTAGCIKGYDYQSQYSTSYPRREDVVRVDYNVTASQRLFGHWIYNSNTYQGLEPGPFVLGSNLPIGNIFYANPGSSWAVGHSWTLSPTMTNELNLGSTFNSIRIDTSSPAYTRTTSGAKLPLLYPSANQEDLLPQVAFAGTKIGNSPTFGTADAPFINHNRTFDLTDSVSKIWGKHAMKFGMYLDRSWKDQTSFGDFNGSYSFADNSANPFDTGYGYSNAALGVFNSFDQAANMINGQYRYWQLEFYAQDTWKVTSRLTLDYGIRAAWYQPQYDASLQASTFVLSNFQASQAPRLYVPVASASCPAGTTGGRCGYDATTNTYVPTAFIGFDVPNTGSVTNGISQGGQNGISDYLQNGRPLQWGPRFGAAWDATGKHNVVVRMGAGMFYDRFQGNRVFDFVRNPPLGVQPLLNYGYAANITPGSALLSPPTVYAADPIGKIPMTMNYTLGIQTKLPFGLVMDTAYVGNIGRHLEDNRNLNYVPYGADFLKSNQDPTLASNCAYNADGSLAAIQPGLCGNNTYLNQFLRPLRGLSSATIYESAATSNFNSLQVTLDRRVGRLLVGAAYTWSKYLTTTPGNTGDTASFRVDQYTRASLYGPSLNDRRQNFALNFVYSIPDKGKGEFMSALINGWQTSGFVAMQTGTPYTPGYSISGVGIQNITGSNTEVAKIGVVAGVNPNTGSDNPYNRINAAAFTAPKLGSLGLESGQNFLTGPGINDTDISLQKEFRMWHSERAPQLTIRGDAFNVFNHTQFSGVNSTLNFSSANSSQNGVFGTTSSSGVFTPSTPSNLYLNPTTGAVNINGFGTVNGARNPRILQLALRLRF
jgi:hypothetical protein